MKIDQDVQIKLYYSLDALLLEQYSHSVEVQKGFALVIVW